MESCNSLNSQESGIKLPAAFQVPPLEYFATAAKPYCDLLVKKIAFSCLRCSNKIGHSSAKQVRTVMDSILTLCSAVMEGKQELLDPNLVTLSFCGGPHPKWGDGISFCGCSWIFLGDKRHEALQTMLGRIWSSPVWGTGPAQVGSLRSEPVELGKRNVPTDVNFIFPLQDELGSEA